MDFFDEILDSIGGALDSVFDGGDSIDIDDISLDGQDSMMSDLFSLQNFSSDSSDFSSLMSASFEGDAFDNFENSNFDCDSDFDGITEENQNSDVSFTGSGDKYVDNSYNQKQADKWLAKEQDCLAKGDKSGAAAAHATAMDHLKRIKS